MAAYWIAHVTVTDDEAYGRYAKIATEAIAAHGGEFIARGGRYRQFEGTERARHVVARFPTFEAAAHLPRALAALTEAAADGLVSETIVSDGGSRDETAAIAETAGCVVVRTAKGRGRQLIAGAQAALLPRPSEQPRRPGRLRRPGREPRRLLFPFGTYRRGIRHCSGPGRGGERPRRADPGPRFRDRHVPGLSRSPLSAGRGRGHAGGEPRRPGGTAHRELIHSACAACCWPMECRMSRPST